MRAAAGAIGMLFQHQHFLTRLGEQIGAGAAAGTGTNDNCVVRRLLTPLVGILVFVGQGQVG
jgi:hypothetical protein